MDVWILYCVSLLVVWKVAETGYSPFSFLILSIIDLFSLYLVRYFPWTCCLKQLLNRPALNNFFNKFRTEAFYFRSVHYFIYLFLNSLIEVNWIVNFKRVSQACGLITELVNVRIKLQIGKSSDKVIHVTLVLAYENVVSD